jgi:hypothetical protein
MIWKTSTVPNLHYHDGTSMRSLKLHRFAAAGMVVSGHSAIFAADFRQAIVVLGSSSSTRQKKAAQMLVEEIEKRTQLPLKIAPEAPEGATAIDHAPEDQSKRG